MGNKYVMINLKDETSKSIAEVLGNKTCKKIIEFLSEIKEASEKDISDSLNIPLNTAEYNLKKLLNSGMVEKTKNYFWSKRGKKIPMYKISNKSIIISPKISRINENVKTILPVSIISAVGAFLLKQYFATRQVVEDEVLFASQEAVSKSPEIESATTTAISLMQPIWIWFLSGAMFAILIFLIISFLRGNQGFQSSENYRKSFRMKGGKKQNG